MVGGGWWVVGEWFLEGDFFLYKNLFYKDIQAEICSKQYLKNMSRLSEKSNT